MFGIGAVSLFGAGGILEDVGDGADGFQMRLDALGVERELLLQRAQLIAVGRSHFLDLTTAEERRQLIEAAALVCVRELEIKLRILPDALVLIVDNHLKTLEYRLDPILGGDNFHWYVPPLG